MQLGRGTALSRTTEQSAGYQPHGQGRYIVIATICGVDVAKAWLDGWVAGAGHRRFGNDAAGWAELAAWARRHGVTLVAMEASGGAERDAFAALWAAGLACALANAREVRDFARAMGKLEKTDRIDAEVIARFAATRGLKPQKPASEAQSRLTELSTRLRQLTGTLSAEKKRLHTTRDALALTSLRKMIAFLKQEIEAIADAITALIRSDPVWAGIEATLRSVKGVSDRTVAVLLAEMPELGLLSGKAIAKLAGLAPLADDSGLRSGHRAIRGGRTAVRSILYLVADIARKYDPNLAEFKQRLLAQGKPKMVVRTAMARKLIVQLNAKVRDATANMAN